MTTDSRAWKESIRELYQGFERIDSERDLLRKIDLSIIQSTSEDSHVVQAVFIDSIARLSAIYRVPEPGQFYVYTGDRLVRLEQAHPHDSRPTSLITTPGIRRLMAAGGTATRLLSDDDDPALFAQLPEVKTALLQPIFTHANDFLGVVAFFDVAECEGSDLAKDEFTQSLHGVAQQLTIAYDHWHRENEESALNDLWELFLSSRFGPSQCFVTLARRIPRFLPDFGPLRLASPPEVQILVPLTAVVKEHLGEHVRETEPQDAVVDVAPQELVQAEVPKVLIIRASTGHEPADTRVDVSDSISGLLVERSVEELPLFCADPRGPEGEGRYKSYLGVDKKEPIRTELAIRLMVDGQLVGILNLESEFGDAFNVQHQLALGRLAEVIAPMVAVFEERIAHNTVMHGALAATTSTYLDSVAGIFRHGIGTPLVTLRTSIDLLRRLTNETPSLRAGVGPSGDGREREVDLVAMLHEAIDRLDAIQEEITEFAGEFAGDISGFSELGRFDLRALSEDTASLVRRSLLTNSPDDIDILVEDGARAEAFCSLLLKQHLFSLLSNAVYSIQLRMETDRRPGKITIGIDEVAPSSSEQEVSLNRRWRLRIRDNGVGATEVQLSKLLKFRSGVRFRPTPGHGYGLLAVQRYMASVGGAIDLRSEYGEYFEVELLFDQYRSDVHGPLSGLE